MSNRRHYPIIVELPQVATITIPPHLIPTPGEVAALVYAFRQLAGEDADDLAAIVTLNKLELLAQLRES